MSQTPKYATLFYEVRKQLDINWLDYILLDMIYHLSSRTGYCFKSVRSMSRDLDMSFEAVRTSLNRLASKELLIKNNEGYRCSDRYYDMLVENRPKNSQVGDRKVVKGDRKTVNTDYFPASEQIRELHNNNNENNNIVASDFDNVFEEFRKMRKTIRKPLTERAERLIRKELDKLYPSDVSRQIACLEQSIMNSWQGVFPIRGHNVLATSTQVDTTARERNERAFQETIAREEARRRLK